MGLFRFKFNVWKIKFVLAVMSLGCFCSTGQNSFTPTDFQIPIIKIVLSTDVTFGVPSGEVMTLYECKTEDCMVPITQDFPFSYTRVLQEIKAETYRYLTVSSCAQEQNQFNATLRGTVILNDWVYYTHTDYGLDARMAAETPQDVTVAFQGCNYYYELHEPFTVEDSIELPLTLFVDLDNIAWANKSIQGVQSGCYESENPKDNNTYSVCVGFPHMVPIISFDSPQKIEYYIHPPDQSVAAASGKIVLYVDESSPTTVLGGFARRVFSPTSTAFDGASFDMSVRPLQLNANGTYILSTFGQYFNTTQLVFDEFDLTSASTGTFTNQSGITNAYQSTVSQ
jgi:hypothetical protein